MKPSRYYDRPAQNHILGQIAPHGTPTRYVQHKCRCAECRTAISRQNNIHYRRRGYGMTSDWEDSLVDATEAQQYILQLAKQGFGARFLEKASGIGHTSLWEIRSGRRKRIFPGTRDRILGVTVSELQALKDRATVPAKETLRLVDEMVRAGFAKTWINQQIGKNGTVLQVGKTGRVFVGTARAIQQLHDRLWWENAEGFKGHRNSPGGKRYSGRRMREVCRCKIADDPEVIANREAKRRERSRKAAASSDVAGVGTVA